MNPVRLRGDRMNPVRTIERISKLQYEIEHSLHPLAF